MAKVAWNVEKVKPGGVKPTDNVPGSAADEFQFKNDGRTIIEVTNGSAEDMEVTVVTPGTQGGLAVEDRKIAVTKAERRIVGPFDPAVYNDSKSLCTLKFSKVASVKVAVIRTS